VEWSQELGVHRRLLYKWRDRFDPLKHVLVDKTLELDFFEGGVEKVDARRPKSGISGEKASTTKSKK
jgi:hypothetical protein